MTENLMPDKETAQKDTILHVKNLSVSFQQGNQQTHIVKNVSFNVERNTTVALVGESGSGKSLTAHSIMRLLPYPAAFHPSGEIWFSSQGCATGNISGNAANNSLVCDSGIDLAGHVERPVNKNKNEEQRVELLSRSLKSMTSIRGGDIGMIFQEPMSALNPLQTVEKQIGEAVNRNQRLSRLATRDKVLSLLDNVHIVNPTSKLKSYPHQLSGGQRQRVMIAMALANRPKLLIADEPSTALDVTVQKEILDLLKELQEQFHMSILLITHDLGVVKYMAEKVLVMQNGEIVERGETHAILNHPENAYTKLLMDSYPKGSAATLSQAIDQCPIVVSTKDLDVKFNQSKSLFGGNKDFFHALKGIDFELPQGSTLGILGESGSGKSTLALAILRLIKSTGKIELDGIDISSFNEKALRPLRSAMQIVFQDPYSSLSPRMSVKQIISEGLHLQGNLSQAMIDQKVDDIMIEVGLDPQTKDRYPHEFSGGQRQRIAIARAFILNPRLVFLDEPTSALDRAVQMQIITLLRKLQEERQLSYVFISHDIHVIKSISHNILVIKDGEVVEYGDAQQVLENSTHPYTQNLLASTLD